MPSDIKAIALTIFAALAAGCSGTPRTAQPATATTASTTGAAPSSDVDMNLVKAGYSVLRRHNEVFYCRNEVITGNRIATRVCLTASQIQDEKQDVAKAKDTLNQPNYRCLGASCTN